MLEVVPRRRIFLTGAGGRLGSLVYPILLAGGHEVLATDVRVPAPPAVSAVRALNLLDHEAVKLAMAGCDTVVHLGNHSSQGGGPQYRIFNENVAMTMNVLDAARGLGIRKIVYASTIQVIASEYVAGYTARDPKIAYLPLDGDSPADPTNGYALSKLVGEMTLSQMATEFEMEAVSLRYPWLINYERADWRARHIKEKAVSKTTIAQGMSWLSYRDAAELVGAAVAARWTGAKVYFPAAPGARARESIPELLAKYYAGVPLRPRYGGAISSLVDISTITRDTGWVPRDVNFLVD